MGINCVSCNCGSVVSQQQTKVKEKGSFRAYGASQIASLASAPAGLLAMNGMQNENKKLSEDAIKTINSSVDKFIETSGLRAKGVKVVDCKTSGPAINLSGIKDTLESISNPTYAASQGKNAFFNSTTNEVVFSRKKGATAAFHEIGHAINYNSSKFWKVMQCLRGPSMLIASSLAIFGAFSKEEVAEEGKELTKAQKAKNFTRKNIGAITTASMLPVVAEEIMASVRGCKWANSNLPKELAKKVRNTNIWGALSYTATALGLGFAAHIAVKVKDSIMEKEKAKQETNIVQ